MKVGELENREINKLKADLSKKIVEISELETKLELANNNQKNIEDKLKKSEQQLKSSKQENEKKIKELELELQSERKKNEVMKSNQEKRTEK